jgi:phage-related protein
MKCLIALTGAMFLLTLASQAQNKVDKAINNANNSVNSVNNSVNNASSTATNAVSTVNNTATQTKALADQVGGLFGGKKKPVSSVTVKVPGANRAKLKELCAILKTCSGVDAKDVDFDDSQQIVTIGTYKGKLNDLLDELEKKSPQITDNNATTSKADNSITITGF